MRKHLTAISAVLAAGFGIVLGNTVADVTNDAESKIFSSNGQSSSLPENITLMCLPLEQE